LLGEVLDHSFEQLFRSPDVSGYVAPCLRSTQLFTKLALAMSSSYQGLSLQNRNR
jgi:hypothetical protein